MELVHKHSETTRNTSLCSVAKEVNEKGKGVLPCHRNHLASLKLFYASNSGFHHEVQSQVQK